MDLPDGGVGYRSSTSDRNGTMVFAPADGDRLVVVGASRSGGEPEAEVLQLLETAQERAPDLEDLPSKSSDS